MRKTKPRRKPRRRAKSAFALPKGSLLMMSAHLKPGGQVQVYVKPETPFPHQWGVVVGLLAHAASEMYADPARAKEEILSGIVESMRLGPRAPSLLHPGDPPLLITVQ